MTQQTSPRSESSTATKMSDATLQARANARARSEHVHIFAVAGRQGHYTTKSKSNPGERYNLFATEDGIVGCSCKGFEYRYSCKHAEALLNRLAREAVRAERQLRHAAAAESAGVVRFEGAARIVEPASDLWN